MITSTQNTRIKWVRSLQTQSKARRADQAFVVEGVRLVEEALQAGWETQCVLYTAGLGERGQRLVDGFASRGAPVEEVTESVMTAASDTQTPQGILAVLSQPVWPTPLQLDFAFIPDGVRDPGNLGTMLRTTAAAGAKAVFLPPGAADPFAPKVVRSAMGAHFRLPLWQMGWEQIASAIEQHNLHLFLAAVEGGLTYTQADLRQPLALVIGGEAAGAGDFARRLAHDLLHIPMPGHTESLNAAIAAGILLFEVVRQRTANSDQRLGKAFPSR